MKLLDGRSKGISKTGPGQPGTDQLPAAKKPGALDLAQPESYPVSAAFKPASLGADFIPPAYPLALQANPANVQIAVKGMRSQLVHQQHFADFRRQSSGIDIYAD